MFIPVRSLLPHRKVLKKPNVPQYEELPRTLGEHLRKKRMLSSLAQRVAAEMLGVTEDCVTGWENGRSEPQVQALSAHHRIPGLLPVRSRDQDARRKAAASARLPRTQLQEVCGYAMRLGGRHEEVGMKQASITPEHDRHDRGRVATADQQPQTAPQGCCFFIPGSQFRTR
jgi:DNA-binding XRE family transcriptional regulator